MRRPTLPRGQESILVQFAPSLATGQAGNPLETEKAEQTSRILGGAADSVIDSEAKKIEMIQTCIE